MFCNSTVSTCYWINHLNLSPSDISRQPFSSMIYLKTIYKLIRCHFQAWFKYHIVSLPISLSKLIAARIGPWYHEKNPRQHLHLNFSEVIGKTAIEETVRLRAIVLGLGWSVIWKSVSTTLPETNINSSHLPGRFPKRKRFVFQPSIFRCELLISRRVSYHQADQLKKSVTKRQMDSDRTHTFNFEVNT